MPDSPIPSFTVAFYMSKECVCPLQIPFHQTQSVSNAAILGMYIPVSFAIPFGLQHNLKETSPEAEFTDQLPARHFAFALVFLTSWYFGVFLLCPFPNTHRKKALWKSMIFLPFPLLHPSIQGAFLRVSWQSCFNGTFVRCRQVRL